MKFLLAMIIIACISVTGTRLTFMNRNLPLGIRNILLFGSVYIVIGILLGKTCLNIFDMETLTDFEPFLLFGLSWVGFIFGLQFEIRQLKALPKFYFSITAIQTIVIFFIVTILMFILLKVLFISIQVNDLLIAAITLGSAASCTGQSAIAFINVNYRFKNSELFKLIQYISSVDGFFSLCFFAFAFCVMPENNGNYDFLLSIKKLFSTVITGIIPAAIFISLSRVRFTQQEFLVFLIGTIMFCGGLAVETDNSPLISGFICGIAIANLCRQRLRALSTILHAEKPIYIILLLMIGARWDLGSEYGLILTICYIFFRAMGKYIGTYTATRKFKPLYYVPQGIGMALMSEGGLAIAIVLNFSLLFPEISNSLITIIIFSVMINGLLSPSLILSQFDPKTDNPSGVIKR